LRGIAKVVDISDKVRTVFAWKKNARDATKRSMLTIQNDNDIVAKNVNGKRGVELRENGNARLNQPNANGVSKYSNHARSRLASVQENVYLAIWLVPSALLGKVVGSSLKAVTSRFMRQIIHHLRIAKLVIAIFWNIALSWKNISDDCWKRTKQCITSMVIERITELKIFKFATVGTAKELSIVVLTAGATTS